MPDQWPQGLPVVQVRVARPTDRLEAVVRFYRDGLGLQEIGSFAGHAGYAGVMLGLHWEKEGVTFEYPDGWRVVLMQTCGI
jgi:catechol 2,3-dioxygenase-like lactoylglutathione lyase family enzyme